MPIAPHRHTCPKAWRTAAYRLPATNSKAGPGKMIWRARRRPSCRVLARIRSRCAGEEVSTADASKPGDWSPLPTNLPPKKFPARSKINLKHSRKCLPLVVSPQKQRTGSLRCTPRMMCFSRVPWRVSRGIQHGCAAVSRPGQVFTAPATSYSG